jgi:hypothetical protein
MRSESLRRRARSALLDRFGIDARALGAFRVALGLLVLSDLAMRARHLTAFYTDAGVLPRSTLAETYPLLATLSVHTVTGSTRGQAVLFAVTAVAAAALLVGYRTRLATAVTGYLLLSLYLRNRYVLNGGDGLLVLSLLFGVCLPLGGRWSVDALRDAEPRRRVATLATAAILLQLVVIYVTNAVFKLRSDAWTSGQAVRYVLGLEQFSVGLGPHATAYPELLVAINWLWVAMLLGAPLLVLATGGRRTLVVAHYVCAHLGMLLTLRLGLFPLVTIAMLSVYLPPSVWDRVEARVAEPTVERTGRLRGRLRALVRREPRLPARVRRAGRVAAPVFVAVLLVGSVAWPAAALGGVGNSDGPAVDADDYVWKLFAPNPPTTVRWVVAPATLETGERVDALDGSAVEWDPPDAADTYPSALWHRYFGEMRAADASERRPLGAYLCRRGVPGREASVESVSVYLVEEPVAAAGGGDRRRVEVVSRECADDAPGGRAVGFYPRMDTVVVWPPTVAPSSGSATTSARTATGWSPTSCSPSPG